MTLGADVADRNTFRPGGVVASVTTVAGGGGPVTALQKRLAVDTPMVLIKLIGWDSVILHILRVGMAFGAGLWGIRQKDGRKRIVFGADAVDPVAADADRHFLIPLGVEFPVLAHQIFRILVGRDIRIETSHVGGIGVAGGAELRDLIPDKLTAKSLFRIHRRHLRIFRVAPMAIGTGESSKGMDIIRKPLNQLGMISSECLVTFLATVRRECRRCRPTKEKDEE